MFTGKKAPKPLDVLAGWATTLRFGVGTDPLIVTEKLGARTGRVGFDIPQRCLLEQVVTMSEAICAPTVNQTCVFAG